MQIYVAHSGVVGAGEQVSTAEYGGSDNKCLCGSCFVESEFCDSHVSVTVAFDGHVLFVFKRGRWNLGVDNAAVSIHKFDVGLLFVSIKQFLSNGFKFIIAEAVSLQVGNPAGPTKAAGDLNFKNNISSGVGRDIAVLKTNGRVLEVPKVGGMK